MTPSSICYLRYFVTLADLEIHAVETPNRI